MTEMIKEICIMGEALLNTPPDGTGAVDTPKKAQEAYRRFRVVAEHATIQDMARLNCLLNGALMVARTIEPNLTSQLMVADMTTR